MVDLVDEYAVQQLKVFDDKKLKLITKKVWTLTMRTRRRSFVYCITYEI